MRYVNSKFLSETVRPAAWTFRGQKSLILSRFQSLNFEGQGVFVPYPSFLRLKALQAHFCSFIITSSIRSVYLPCASILLR